LNPLYHKALPIKCLVLDLDGVLTNGQIHLDNEARELRSFNIQDGFGIKLLQAIGFNVAIITGSSDAIVNKRMEQLGIEHFYTKCIHKLEPFNDLKSKLQLEDYQFAYMGDDYQDIVLLEKVGLSFAPHNAIDAVKERVDIITNQSGGHGAVREVCEFFFKLHNKTDELINYFNNYPCQTLEKVY